MAAITFEQQGDRAVEASLQADLRAASTEMESRAVMDGVYPIPNADLAFSTSRYGNTIELLRGDGDGYCLVGSADGGPTLYLDSEVGFETSSDSCV